MLLAEDGVQVIFKLKRFGFHDIFVADNMHCLTWERGGNHAFRLFAYDQRHNQACL